MKKYLIELENGKKFYRSTLKGAENLQNALALRGIDSTIYKFDDVIGEYVLD